MQSFKNTFLSNFKAQKKTTLVFVQNLYTNEMIAPAVHCTLKEFSKECAALIAAPTDTERLNRVKFLAERLDEMLEEMLEFNPNRSIVEEAIEYHLGNGVKRRYRYSIAELEQSVILGTQTMRHNCTATHLYCNVTDVWYGDDIKHAPFKHMLQSHGLEFRLEPVNKNYLIIKPMCNPPSGSVGWKWIHNPPSSDVNVYLQRLVQICKTTIRMNKYGSTPIDERNSCSVAFFKRIREYCVLPDTYDLTGEALRVLREEGIECTKRSDIEGDFTFQIDLEVYGAMVCKRMGIT